LLKTRGVPGTHDVNFMFDFLKKIKKKRFKHHRIPKFNKAIDDRLKRKSWYLIKRVPDVIIFEGWCVGARAEKKNTLKKSINPLEKKEDKNLKWRKFVNSQLENKYQKLFSKLDCMLFLKAGSFKLLQSWRLKQESLLKLNSKNKANNKVMSKNEVLTFMQTYQRITQNMFKFAPKYSSIVLNLNRNHEIKSIKYNK
jgi:D-glycerate 3-kinase